VGLDLLCVNINTKIKHDDNTGSCPPLYGLACQNEIQEILHDENIVSREPEHGAPPGIETITKGKAAQKQRARIIAQ